MSHRAYAHANLDATYGQKDNCKIVTDPSEANLVTSLAKPQWSPKHVMHRPQLDIDIPHQYVPSSTPGHGHLSLDIEVPWDDYIEWLEAGVELGILQQGWVENAKKRGYTTLRKPGVKKTKAQMEKGYPEPVKVDINAKDPFLSF